MSEFTLDILTPVASLFTGRVGMVVVPGHDGYFGVLRGHLPLVAALRPGRITARDSSGERVWICGSGLASVEPDRVTLLVESLSDVPCDGASDQPRSRST